MADKDQGTSERLGENAPGTGGDSIDQGDTEGHRRGPGGHLPSADGGPEASRGGPGGHIPQADGSDVEGHLYTGGPSTQGEFAKRAPSENPHGDE